MTPLGSLAPRRVKRLGSFRNCTTSISSFLASGQPFTSANVLMSFSGRISLLYCLGAKAAAPRPTEGSDKPALADRPWLVPFFCPVFRSSTARSRRAATAMNPTFTMVDIMRPTEPIMPRRVGGCPWT